MHQCDSETCCHDEAKPSPVKTALNRTPRAAAGDAGFHSGSGSTSFVATGGCLAKAELDILHPLDVTIGSASSIADRADTAVIPIYSQTVAAGTSTVNSAQAPIATDSEAPITKDSEAPITKVSEAPIATDSEAPIAKDSETR